MYIIQHDIEKKKGVEELGGGGQKKEKQMKTNINNEKRMEKKKRRIISFVMSEKMLKWKMYERAKNSLEQIKTIKVK